MHMYALCPPPSSCRDSPTRSLLLLWECCGTLAALPTRWATRQATQTSAFPGSRELLLLLLRAPATNSLHVPPAPPHTHTTHMHTLLTGLCSLEASALLPLILPQSHTQRHILPAASCIQCGWVDVRGNDHRDRLVWPHCCWRAGRQPLRGTISQQAPQCVRLTAVRSGSCRGPPGTHCNATTH